MSPCENALRYRTGWQKFALWQIWLVDSSIHAISVSPTQNRPSDPRMKYLLQGSLIPCQVAGLTNVIDAIDGRGFDQRYEGPQGRGCHDSSAFRPGLQPDLLAELLDLMFRFKAVDTVALSAALRCYGKTGRYVTHKASICHLPLVAFLIFVWTTFHSMVEIET